MTMAIRKGGLMNWEPIETAPKDGRAILLKLQDQWVDDSDRVIVGCWWDCWCVLQLVSGYGHFNLGDYDRPTHWCEIPKFEGE